MSHRTEYPTGKELCDALKGKWLPAQRRGKADCPAHADENPSLDIEEKDGRTLVICRAGCTQNAVLELAESEGPLAGAARQRRQRQGRRQPRPSSRSTAISCETGDEHFQVVRFAPKDFRPAALRWQGRLDMETAADAAVPALSAPRAPRGHRALPPGVRPRGREGC